MANKKVSQLVSKPSVLVTDLFPIADPTTGQLFKTTISDLGTAIGSGVSSVNTLVGAVVLDTDDIQELASPTNRWFTDTRARAALSAASPLAYNSGTGVFSLPQADGSTNGFLSSADWTTFNNKLSTATAASTYVPYTGATANVNLGLNYSLTAALIIKSGGTSTQFLKADGSIDTNTYLTTGSAASTYLALAGGTLTGDLTLSSGNPRLYFTDTDNNPDYFISNTDGTFTIYDVTNSISRFTIGTTGNGTFGGNLTVGQIIRSGGTSSQFLKADGSVDSTAYLPLAGGTLTGALFATSASFSGFVGFGGNTSPLAAIDVTGAGIFSSSVRSSGYYLTGMTSGSGALYYSSGSNRVTVANYNTSGIVTFEVNGGSTALTLNSNLSATFASTLSATGATLTGALSGTSATFTTGFNNTINIAQSSGSTTLGHLGQFADSLYISNNYFFNGSQSYDDTSKANSSIEMSTGVIYLKTGLANTVPSTKVTINSSGNVGIGTTAPTTYSLAGRHLELNDAGGGYSFFHNCTTTVKSFYAINESSLLAALFTFSSHPLTFGTANTERMRITSVGHIQTNGNPVYAYSGSISIGGTYQTIFAAVSGGVYLVSVTTDSADGTFGLLTVVNDPDKSLGMIYGNNISLQFSGDNVQMKSTNGSTYNTTWTATRLK